MQSSELFLTKVVIPSKVRALIIKRFVTPNEERGLILDVKLSRFARYDNYGFLDNSTGCI